MRTRKIGDDGYTNKALLTTAQIGIGRRYELSQAMCSENENGEMISRVGRLSLVRAIKRLKEYGYIATAKCEDTENYYMTKDGWSYIQKIIR